MINKQIELKKGKDMPVKAGHPWIFSGGIHYADPALKTGDIADVYSADGSYLASGSYHRDNSIRVRIISKVQDLTFGTDYFIERFRALSQIKKKILPEGTTGYRLVHSDADSMPGLVIDIYADNIVIQINTAAMENFRPHLIESLVSVFAPKAIIERSDLDNRRLDHLQPLDPVCRYGSTSDGLSVFTENNIKMISDMMEGQKTGFFLDQRDARIYVKNISSGRRVLNLFSYTGGFSVSAAAGGAEEIISVDVSKRALKIAQDIFELNSGKISGKIKTSFIEDDVFDYLSKNKRNFDIIICDPPAFAKKKENIAEASKAYIRLNRMCMEATSLGTIIVSSSCSGMLGWSDFSNILRISTGQAGKEAAVIAEFSQAPDHTRKISFPEGNYLKTAVLLVN